jgi:hypothetical protein
MYAFFFNQLFWEFCASALPHGEVNPENVTPLLPSYFLHRGIRLRGPEEGPIFCREGPNPGTRRPFLLLHSPFCSISFTIFCFVGVVVGG